nr:GlxA family transcriptional regulator [uncultured Gellertiella sp.]
MSVGISSPRSFVFYIVPDFTMLAFTSAIEALRLANAVLGEAVYSWRIASADGAPVRASCGLMITPDHAIAAERVLLAGDRRPSMIVVCSGWNVENHVSKTGAAWLREARQRQVEIAGVCTGAYLLADAGLLENRHCTIHWENLPVFEERFSQIAVHTGLMESDGGIHSCAGGAACFDMMMHIVGRDFGPRVVSAVLDQAMVDRIRAPSERQRMPLTVKLSSLNPKILKAIELMEEHLADRLPMEEIASAVCLSRRQVERLFQLELETSPSRYYLQLRLERARLLVTQSAMQVVEIAIACGFVSASHFSKCYRHFHGVSPQETRDQRQTSVQMPALRKGLAGEALPAEAANQGDFAIGRVA